MKKVKFPVAGSWAHPDLRSAHITAKAGEVKELPDDIATYLDTHSPTIEIIGTVEEPVADEAGDEDPPKSGDAGKTITSDNGPGSGKKPWTKK